MCGISALFALGVPLDPTAIRAMTAPVRHRGPDDEGYALFAGDHLEPACLGGPDTPAGAQGSGLPYAPAAAEPAGPVRAALGHRRLAILDLSAAGHQPMCSPDRRLWVTYNGEIYNYRELRTELESAGARFRSGTDTEVILEAWRAWGPACLDRFNGMFAFVLLDREAGRVFAARDRFGVKPLYYRVGSDATLCFASEIKQFAARPDWRPAATPQRCYDYLAWGLLDHTDETMFAGVFQLRGGECLDLYPWSPGALQPQPGARIAATRWYAPRGARFEGNFAAAAAAFAEKFGDAARLRLRSDVPVGSCLSGGLDSSAIVCTVNGMLREGGGDARQNTFSARSDDPRFDEGRFIGEVVDATGVAAHFVVPRLDEVLDELDRLTWHQDEPFGSTSIFAQWEVFRLARAERTVVMLDGQGADEQLAGYFGFLAPRYGTLLRSGRLGELAREMAAVKRELGLGYNRSAQYLLDAVLPQSLRQTLRGLAGRSHARPDWLSPERLGAVASDPLRAAGGDSGDLEAMSIRQLTATHLPMLLHWEDRNSMAHSVEARLPFLDFRLVEFLLGLPEEFLLYRGETKRVLREAMRGVLPEAVRVRRDKMGFVTSEREWFRGPGGDAFESALRDAVERCSPFVTDRLLDRWRDVRAGRSGYTQEFWRVVNFARWAGRFGVALPAVASGAS